MERVHHRLEKGQTACDDTVICMHDSHQDQVHHICCVTGIQPCFVIECKAEDGEGNGSDAC